jgi:hypothetical protein
VTQRNDRWTAVVGRDEGQEFVRAGGLQRLCGVEELAGEVLMQEKDAHAGVGCGRGDWLHKLMFRRFVKQGKDYVVT